MTHLSEAIPTPILNQGHIWHFFGAVDRPQWRWEAPTPRSTKEEGRAASLPSWLSDWDTASQEVAGEASLTGLKEEKLLVGDAPTIKDDIRHFREIFLGEADPSTQIAEFNRRLEQNLALGLVSGDMLTFTLRRITDNIREGSKPAEIGPRCLAFYRSVWRGISTSKVLGPADFEGKIMNEFISLILHLPPAREVLVLARHILSSVSRSQLESMELGIISVLKAWSESWFQTPAICDSQVSMQRAEDSVLNAETKYSDAHHLSMILGGKLQGENKLIKAQEGISAVHVAIRQALECIADAELAISPLKESTKLLADTLCGVPHDILLRVSSSFLEDVIMTSSRQRWERRVMRHCWLSTLAQIPSVDTKYFIQTWKNLETADKILDSEASELILSHWISQGYIKNAAIVRISYETIAQRAGKEDFASLLFALDKHRENALIRTRELFLLLDSLGKYKRVYTTLSRMKDFGLKVPVSFLSRAIDMMSNYDARLALKTFHLHKVILLDEKQMRLDWIPNFIIALINHKGITPNHIWEILEIPVYEALPRSQRHFKPSAMSQTMRDLLHKMALAFASSNARPPRVALRNVLQCLYHLRVHRAPIGPELSRAVTRLGITNEIGNGKWIRQERLRYALHLISEVEGKDVAKEADATVLNWRIYLSEKQARENREGNVLRVGVIS